MARDERRGGGERNALTPQHEEKFRLIASEIERQRSVIEMLLGGDIGWDFFMRAVTVALKGNPYILTMPADTLVQACMEAAQDRLVPDGTLGAIVPRYNWRTDRTEATWQPMYQGLLQVARKYAGVLDIDCELVFEGEEFHSEKGTNPNIRHIQNPALFDLDKITAAYCVIWFRDNPKPKTEVMDRASLEEVRKSSEAVKRGKPTPWTGPFRGEMYRKTVLLRGWKWVPVTGENAGIVTNAAQRVFGEQMGMPQKDSLAAAGVAVPKIAAPDPLPNLADSLNTGQAKSDIISDQLAALASKAAVEAWLMEPARLKWMDGLRRNQLQKWQQIRTMIDQHLAAVDPDSRDSGAEDAEGLPFFAPDPNSPDEWRLFTVTPYDGLTLPEAYVEWWKTALRRFPDMSERLHKENFQNFDSIARQGDAYRMAVQEASRLVEVTRAHFAAKRAKAEVAEMVPTNGWCLIS